MEKEGFFTNKKWLENLIFVGAAFIISFFAYIIFSSRIGVPSVELYQPELNFNEASAVASQGRAFINSINDTWVVVVGFVLLALLVIGVLLLAIFKKLNWKWMMLAVFVLAVLIRVIYTNITDNIFTRQYDVWSNNYMGHYAITMHIYREGTLPDLKGTIENSYQMYHPKYAHYIFALVMHINSLFFGRQSDSFTLYESIRIFTCALSIIQVYVSYLIMKELFKNKWAILGGTLFISVSPLLIRNAAGSNNDTLLYFFLFLSILFAIRFFKHNGWVNIVGAALSIGLAMGSKLSGALIAIPIGVLFIYKFVLTCMNKNKKDISGLITYYVIFLLICAPIGLFWPIYNKNMYDQPLTFVWHKLNESLRIPSEYSYSQKYLFFSFDTMFTNIYHGGWNTQSFVDYNTWTDLMKSSIFGEYSFAKSVSLYAVGLYAINYVILIGIAILWGYLIIKNLLQKRWEYSILLVMPLLVLYMFIFSGNMKNSVLYLIFTIIVALLALGGLVFLGIKYKFLIEKKAYVFFMLIFLVFLISYFTFQLQYEYTCTHDFRYVGMFLLCFAFVIGSIIEKAQKEMRIVVFSLLGLYSLFSTFLYLSIN